MLFQGLKNFILDLLFPQFCIKCQAEGSVLCYDCLNTISLIPFLYCPFCAKITNAKQGLCQKHRHKFLDGCFAAVSYKEKLAQKAISDFKYKPFLKALSKPLSFLIVSHILLSENKCFFQGGDNSLFAPLPLSKRKQKERGFNQSERVAKELSLFFHIPLLKNNLIKTRETISQTNLNRQERKANVRGAFALKNPKAVFEKKIFLVDDVLTTSATLEEAAKVLKKAGALSVWACVIAREPLG